MKQLFRTLGFICCLSLVFSASQALAADGFPVESRCFTSQNDLVMQDGLMYSQTNDDVITLGGRVADVWYLVGEQPNHLFRFVDWINIAPNPSRTQAFIVTLPDSERYAAYLLETLSSSPRRIFSPYLFWFTPQWLSNDHILFNVITADDETPYVVTTTLTTPYLVLESSEDPDLWLADIYRFEGAQPVIPPYLYPSIYLNSDETYAVVLNNTDSHWPTWSSQVKLYRLDDQVILWETETAMRFPKIYWRPDGSSFVYSQTLSDEITLFHPGEPDFEPNELMLVTTTPETIQLTAHNIADTHNHYISTASWSTHGRYLLYVLVDINTQDSRLYIIDFVEQRTYDTCQRGHIGTILWSPDGEQVVYSLNGQWLLANTQNFEYRNLDDLLQGTYPIAWLKWNE